MSERTDTHVKKSKLLCAGCRDDYYNHNVPGGCWRYAESSVVVRFRLEWWTAPESPKNFVRIETLNCHRQTGWFAYFKQMPEHLAGREEEVPVADIPPQLTR